MCENYVLLLLIHITISSDFRNCHIIIISTILIVVIVTVIIDDGSW